MRKLLVASVSALALVSGAAHAADMALKAPLLVGYPYAGSGFYVGIGAQAEVASATVSSIDVGTSLYSAGAALTGTVGYQGTFGRSANWYAVENIVSWTNIGGTVTCATTNCSIGSTFGVEQRFKFGFPIATVLSFLPNWQGIFPSLPPLPNGIVSTSSHPYISAGLHEDDVSASLGLMTGRAWQVTPAIGMGMINQWTNGLVVDVGAEYSFKNTAFNLGGPQVGIGAANQGSAFRTYVSFLY
jgi:hypothetical protein